MFWGLFNFGPKSLVDSEYFLKCWKCPSNSCETFKILFLHENSHFRRKKSMFWGFFTLDQNLWIRTVPAWPFFGWFWVFFEMLKIPFQLLWNIQNFVPSWKQSVSRKKSMFWELFNFRKNRAIRTLPAWPFFGWFWVFFEMMKISCQLLWNIQNFVLLWIQSVSRKKSMFLELFNFRSLPVWPFFVDFEYFLKCWKYPSNSSETFKILFFHEDNQFEEKKACFGDFSIWTKIAVSGPYWSWPFFVDFEYFLKCWKYPSNSPETFKILFFHEDNQFEKKKPCFGEKKHVLGTFQFSAKSLYPVLTGVAIFWLILSIFLNDENILPILVKHSKFCSFMNTIIFKKKKACFRDTSILTKIALPDRTGLCHFSVDFEYFLKCWKYHSNSSETFKILFFHEDNQFEEKKAFFGDFLIWTKISESGLTGVAIFWLVLSIFWNVENTLPIVVKHSKFCSFMKTISFKKKRHVLGTFQFSAKSRYPDLTGVAIFWLILSIFWNDENILPIVVKHSKFCSFMNTVSFKKKKHVLGTFQFPDRTGVAIFWLILSIFWNVENTLPILLKHSKFCSFMKTISLKKKKKKKIRHGHFLGIFWNLELKIKILYPDSFELTGVAIFWLILSIFWNVENTLPILVKHSKLCSFMKIISLKKKSHVLGTFQFSAKSLYPDLTGVAIFWLLLSIFWNDENILPILVKHSKFCSFRKTISLKKKKACFRDTSILTKIAVSGTVPREKSILPVCHFSVDFEYFLKYWKYPSNSSETFKILFFHENNQFEEKKGMFCGHFNLDQNRCIRTLPV